MVLQLIYSVFVIIMYETNLNLVFGIKRSGRLDNPGYRENWSLNACFGIESTNRFTCVNHFKIVSSESCSTT